MKHKIRNLDAVNQIVSKAKRLRDNEMDFKSKLFLPSKRASKEYVTARNTSKDKEKFSQLGKVYMKEYSRFKYKVDAIVNDAYLYVKDLQA
jgi:hypothetical protein